jgi:phosphoglycolate phosphatase-like HAD superfamily hydrolase/pyrimidine operon attenuation protein/uracil phosphoribosyltransferase
LLKPSLRGGETGTLPLMPIDAIVFDLDDTLLDSSELARARTERDWVAVKEGLGRVRAFPVPDDGVEVESLPSRLRASGLKVGILTSSPRWYAETLLAQFEISADAMITGSEPYPPKPDPTSLRQIIADLGVDASRCAYVGDRGIDVAAAAGANVLSIGSCWQRRAPEDWRRWWPDVAIALPERLLDPAGLPSMGPLAEVLLAGGTPAWHWGTLMRLEPGVLACGRYFTPEDVTRHPGHALSALILRAKDDAEGARWVAEILSHLGERPSWRQDPPELIVSVPPRPGQDFDRFAPVRAQLAQATGARDGAGVLSMLFHVPDYKRMGPDDRRASNRDRFRSGPLHGETVILVDDVITSGGQTGSCREQLMRAGARSVTILALAATQNRLPESCPNCGAHLRIYRRHRDGRPFVGCPNYFTTRCPYTRDLEN